LRVLLDTQTIVYLADEALGLSKLGKKAQAIVEDPENDLLISSISITEIAVQASLNKLAIGKEELQTVVEGMRASALPFDSRHARELFALPLHHRDPFDRMLIATALYEQIPIVSGDTEFKRYKGLRVIWK
jgi:PIN domain nuclease of toxin-antitoxin system